MKKLFLICNAHLDPVWQWEWEEGAAEAVSTFRTAVKFCREFDTFIFNHNEALLYKWIKEYEPALFEDIKELVKLGKWHIMGGWHLQPDCNMPSGESFVRQINSGLSFFEENFGVRPTTAINFDSFGHNRGLVQILKKSGYDSYMFMRPSEEFISLPDNTFKWKGFDGSEILARRTNSYGSHYGEIRNKIEGILEDVPEDGFSVCLWGVGDHGGGASKPDIETIEKMKTELEEKGVELIHSTPEEFFGEVKKHEEELPVFDNELNLWAPGCYTSIVRIKQQHRKLENMLYMTERMATAASENGFMEYPQNEFDEAQYDLLTCEFHDVLPGSCIQAGEESALRQISHGQEILSRVKMRVFLAMAGGQKKADDDKIPVLVFNPHPYTVEGDFECEMMLWDQNWKDEFSYPQIFKDGKELPTQCEKERSSLNLDWRKKVVFHAKLEPMQMNRFDCAYKILPQKPIPATEETDEFFIMKNSHTVVKISKKTGMPTSYCVDGKEFLKNSCEAEVIADSCDPWGMTVTSFPEKTGCFEPMEKSECKKFCGIKADIEPVHCIESGDVRTTVESFLEWNNSRIVIHYTLSEFSNELKINIRVFWAETQKMLKFSVPSEVNGKLYGQVAYGEQVFPQNGRENVAQKYVYFNDGKNTLGVINDGTYGFSADGDILHLTLLRSAAFCAHPIGDRDIISQDRYTPHMEQGERVFDFTLFAGDDCIREQIPRKADIMNEQPMSLSFYPPENKEKPKTLLSVEGDEVQIPVCKKSNDGKSVTVRLFNPFDRTANVTLLFSLFGKKEKVSLAPFEIKTFVVTKDEFTQTDLCENLSV